MNRNGEKVRRSAWHWSCLHLRIISRRLWWFLLKSTEEPTFLLRSKNTDSQTVSEVVTDQETQIFLTNTLTSSNRLSMLADLLNNPAKPPFFSWNTSIVCFPLLMTSKRVMMGNKKKGWRAENNNLLDGGLGQILTADRQFISTLPVLLLKKETRNQSKLLSSQTVMKLTQISWITFSVTPSAGFCCFLNMLLKMFFS